MSLTKKKGGNMRYKFEPEDKKTISKAYEVVFNKLRVTIDTKEHKKWIEIENRIVRLDSKVMRQLGLGFKDFKKICPLKRPLGSCKVCQETACKFKPKKSPNNKYYYTRVLRELT